MEGWGTVVGMLGLLVALTFFLISRKKDYNLPPSPSFLPLIGHLHHVIWAGLMEGLPHHVFSRLARRYGPIYYLQLGSIRAVVVSDSRIAKELLKEQDSHFADRPKLAVAKYILYDFQDIVFGDYTKEWRDTKKFLATEFLSARKLEAFSGVRKDEMSWFVLSLEKASIGGRPFQMKKYLDGLSYNVITRIIMGKRYFGVSPENKLGCESGMEFRRVIDDVVSFSVAGSIADFFPSLEWLDWSINGMKQVHSAVNNFLQSVIDDHEGSKGPHAQNDFVDMVRSAKIIEKDDRIKAVLLDMIGGGTETSSTAVEWTIAEILTHPEVLVKAQAEVDSVVGVHRCVEESDIRNMPYLQAIVKESLRLHPPLSLLVPRYSTKDCKLQGYDIPKGTTVFVNIYAIGRDPNVWEDALVFNPERFLSGNKDINLLGHDFELLPFGAGRRGCPGLALGLSNVQITIATLLHCFDWNVEKAQIVFEEGKGGTTNMKVPLKALPTPRVKLSDMYSTCHCTDPL